MINLIKRIRYCFKCPYKLGLIEYIVNPCINCIVYGGKNPPPSMDRHIYKNKKK
ncbi:MAG: hypothetical protein SPE43_03985 [Ruminococcus sp.]|nr:hypothetical protein [Oscillospiraceae bacterium]MDY4413518.1 hypothetical protein [Ruminococcus sp.]